MVLSFPLFENRLGLVANAVGWPILSFGLGLLVFAGAERDTIIGKYHLPFVGWLAAASYSLYLMHKAADHVVQAHWGSSLAQTWGVGPFLSMQVPHCSPAPCFTMSSSGPS